MTKTLIFTPWAMRSNANGKKRAVRRNEYLAQLVDRTPRSIMYMEIRGQKPSLNVFYQLVTLLEISADQSFFPDKLNGESACRKQIDVMLNSIKRRYRCFSNYI